MDVVAGGGVGAVLGFVAPLVAFAGGDAALDAAAAEPVGEDVGVVVAAFATLGAGHSTEFGGPEDEGVIEEAALFEIDDEGGDGFGHAPGERAVVALDVFMAVPVAAGETVVVAAPDLHEADAAFDEASGGQAFAAHVVGFFFGVDLGGPDFAMFLNAIHGFHRVGFFADVERFWCGELHLGGELVALDAGIEAGVFFAMLLVLAVEFFQESEAFVIGLGADVAACFVREEIADGGLCAGVDDGACVLGGKEGAVPVFGSVGGESSMVWQDDEGG